VWFIDLAPLTDQALVPVVALGAIGAREQPGRSAEQTLIDVLRSRTTLLVLDNCEHVITACAGLVYTLLRTGPRLCVLATSREPLGLSGETRWRVPSLSLPDADRPPAREQLLESSRASVARSTRYGW
jgi:predicted ATPase